MSLREPWYLAFDSGLPEQRKPGIPNDTNPRTDPSKQLIADNRDLHELHALMASRPFLVSGGSEDTPAHWTALNPAIAVALGALRAIVRHGGGSKQRGAEHSAVESSMIQTDR